MEKSKKYVTKNGMKMKYTAASAVYVQVEEGHNKLYYIFIS